MSMLSTSHLNYMRDVLEQLMPDTCNILSVTRTSDGQGGMIDTWGTASASVICRLDAMQGSEIPVGGAIQPFRAYILTLPWDTTIAEANRIEVGTEVFNIKSVDKQKSWAATRRALLERE